MVKEKNDRNERKLLKGKMSIGGGVGGIQKDGLIEGT
jgi:hypothetical protein